MTLLWLMILVLLIVLVGLLWGLIGLLLLLIMVIGLLSITTFRQHWIAKPLWQAFRQAMPPLSATEREALESGTIWWDGQLFSGHPDWQQLLASKPCPLTDEERAFLNGSVAKLCAQLDDWTITHQDHDLPEAVWQYLKDEGFFGLIIPKAYGGLGFSAVAYSQVILKIASRSLTAAVTVMVPNSLGPAELLLHYGTEQQKNDYLPKLASGELLPCFALTGPEAGSDASNLPDTGIICQREFEGELTTGILLNWEKRYITLGPVATLLGLAFHLYDPDQLLGGDEDIGITLALIPTDTPGVEIGSRHWPMGMAFQNGPNWGHDVFIPLNWIIGGQTQAGQGWKMLMESLAAGRAISLPALSAGAAKLACQTSSAYALIRRQFHLPIGRFEGIADVLGRMAALTYMIDATRLTTAEAVASGERPAVLSAIAKYHLTETMRRVLNDAMDLHGGKAISLGPTNLLAHAYQAIPISITVEGANILTRNLIIFGQGSIRAHPHLIDEMATLDNDDVELAVSEFDRLLRHHIGHVICNIGRSFVLSLTKGRGSTAPRSILKRYYQQLNHLSAALTVATDLSLAVLGGSLKRKESLSARLGDVLSYLYLASCTLRHYETRPDEHALPVAHWACQYAIYRAQQALLDFCDNLPNRFVAHFIRFISFPIGARYKQPDDTLTHRIAAEMIQASTLRHHIIDGIDASFADEGLLTELEAAFTACLEAEPIEKKLKQAGLSSVDEALENKLIDEAEYLTITTARAARKNIISVDHFSADLGEVLS